VKIIYEPKGAALEYSKLALNPYLGCTHACVYCYNNGRHSKKGEFFKSAKPRMGIILDIIKDLKTLKDKYGNDCPEIQISFLGDAYQPAESTIGLTRLIIQQIIHSNLPFTILTKSSLILRDLDILAPYRKFRLGISFTTVDQREAAEWEPGTGYVEDRISVMRKFKDLGVKTWVSLEPVMRVESTINVIKKVHYHTDHFWIGALNHMSPPEPINLPEAHRDIMKALEFRHCKYKFKASFTDM
jgi:DNA repair photolyase